MKEFHVSLEIDVLAHNPLEAANILQGWLDDADTYWQYFVQDEETKEVFSVDLDEVDEEDKVIKIGKYEPIIKQ